MSHLVKLGQQYSARDSRQLHRAPIAGGDSPAHRSSIGGRGAFAKHCQLHALIAVGDTASPFSLEDNAEASLSESAFWVTEGIARRRKYSMPSP